VIRSRTPAIDHGLGPDEGRHEQRGDVALGAADLDQIAEAGGREHGHRSAAPLENGVGAHGRAVHEPPHVAGGDAEGGEAVEHRGRLAAGARGDLGDDHAAGGFVDRGQVREGAADVDPDDEHAADDTVPA
jgi:hypothetical protein